MLIGTAKPASLLTLAVIIFRLPSLWEPRWYSDEGTFTTVAWLHSLGVALYAGAFDNSPPGIYWLYGMLLQVGADQQHVVVQAALLIAVLVAVLCVFVLARRWFGGRVALAAALLCAAGLSLPTLDGDLLNVEVAALPFFLGAFVLAYQKRTGWAFAAGALAAAALLIRPSYALDCLVLPVALLAGERSLRRLLFAAAGAVVTIGAAGLLLLAGGSLQSYLGQVSADQRAYLVWANGGSSLPLIVRLALLTGVTAVWLWRSGRGPGAVLAIWLPASIAGASLAPRELSHYAIEVIPPLAVGIAALTDSAMRTWLRGPRVRMAAAVLAAPIALVLLVAAAEAVLIVPAQEVAFLQGTQAPPPLLHNFSYAALPGYYARWVGWVSHDPFHSQDLTGFPGPIREEAAEAQLLDHLAGGSPFRLLVLGDRAWIYFLSRLPAAVPYVAQNSGYRLLPNATADVTAALDDHRAQLVVVADAPAGDWHRRLEADGYQMVASSPWPTFSAP